MRVLVVGALGSIGKRHCTNLLALGHDVIQCDHRQETMRLVDVPTALQEKPDAIVIATPPESHLRIARECLLVGAPLFIEKPFCLSRAHGERFLAEAAATRTTVAVGYQLRALLGEVRWPKEPYAAHAEFAYDLRQWRTVPATYTASILYEASHEVDALLHLFGPVARIAASGDESLFKALFVHKNGVLSSLHLDSRSPVYRRTLTAYGRDEAVTWAYDRGVGAAAYQHELEAWLAGSPYCTGREALDVVAVCEVAETAMNTGQWEDV